MRYDEITFTDEARFIGLQGTWSSWDVLSIAQLGAVTFKQGCILRNAEQEAAYQQELGEEARIAQAENQAEIDRLEEEIRTLQEARLAAASRLSDATTDVERASIIAEINFYDDLLAQHDEILGSEEIFDDEDNESTFELPMLPVIIIAASVIIVVVIGCIICQLKKRKALSVTNEAVTNEEEDHDGYETEH